VEEVVALSIAKINHPELSITRKVSEIIGKRCNGIFVAKFTASASSSLGAAMARNHIVHLYLCVKRENNPLQHVNKVWRIPQTRYKKFM
jgi:hypothetical protein